MASLRSQILTVVEGKLDQVVTDLSMTIRITNPRELVGQDQMDALIFWHGGDREPAGLTGHVDRRWLEFSVGWMVLETDSKTAEARLDEVYVAVSDALMDPSDIQLTGLAVSIEQGTLSDPVIGRGPEGARIMGGQACDFAVEYFAREGDASSVGP